MQLRDRPLLVDGIDRDLYLERPGLERAIEVPLSAGRNVLLLGEPGAGKTTLMRRVAQRLRHHDRPVAWVNASLADDAVTFLELTARALGSYPAQPSTLSISDEQRGGAVELLRRVRDLRRPANHTIMVDGLLDATIGYDLFGRLRDELWEIGHSWLVASRRRDSSQLRTPPADSFWGSIVEIPPLDRAETSELLRRGLDRDEYASLSGESIEGIYPRALIRAIEKRFSTGPEAGLVDAELLRRARRLGNSEQHAMLELLQLGRPASAHDEELLERLGWSRPYAQRVLAQLETANLVRSIPDRSSEQPGRPRKLYEPNPNLPST